MSKLRAFSTISWRDGPLTSCRFVYRHLKKDKSPLPLTFGGVRIAVRPATPDYWAATESLDTNQFSLLREYVVNPNYIVDAGGYIGTTAIAFARIFPKATIISIEPRSSNFELLSVNTRDYPNIIPLKAALSPTEGTVDLHDWGTGEWGFTILARSRTRALNVIENDIPCISIPSLMSQFNIASIDILKLDIEGAEKALLENSGAWMAKVGAIYVETHDRLCPGCQQAFDEATKRMVRIPQEREKCLAVRSLD